MYNEARKSIESIGRGRTEVGEVSKFDPEAPQAIASGRFSQGPYAAAKTGLKPTTFQTKGV